jgi:hypothetical protein
MKKRLALLCVAALSMAACGSSDGAAATATEGDAFCKLAQVAADDHDAVDSMDFTDSTAVKLQLGAAIDSLSAAAAKAPKDIADTVKSILADQEDLESLLQKNDFDIVKLSTTDEGKALIDKAAKSTNGDEFDAYLTDKCGIERPDDSESADTTPLDTTPASDTIGDDTIGDGTIADDTGISVDLGEGEEAINKFLDYYELGTSSTLSDEDRSCIVDALVGKVTGDELNEAIAGTASDDLNQALGLAFLGCNVEVQS